MQHILDQVWEKRWSLRRLFRYYW